ncbi:MAG: iron ABC transporter permease [Anaerolineae bacterium]|nr:iron ABC transporter permease [Chloroflexota bacterium]MBN8636874.1 iron ABC transporter permease [Anaerolineae bacterium]
MLLPPAFLLIFFFYPLISLFVVSLTPDGVLDLSGFAEIFTDDYYIRIFLFTTGQAALSTLLTVGLALPGAYAFARFDFPGKALLLSVSTLPFVLPTVVVAAAFSALIGERGILPLNLEGTLTIILIAHVFYNYALALRMISSYWATQSPRIEEAARVLGAHGWRLWWEIRLAAIRPAILASSALIFIFCFTSFGVMLILGGIRFATLEVEIYRQANSLLNLQIAAALSIFQLALMFALMLVYTRLQAQTSTDLQAAQTVARTPKTPREKLFVGGNIALMAVLLFAPLIALLLRSFWSANGWTLQYYAALSTNARGSVLFVPPLEAVGNSVVYALLTTVLSLILGLIAAYGLARRGRLSSLLDPIYMLPLATSAVTLGFGFIIALDEPPLNLRTSRALIVIAHTLVAMPFVVRSVLPALRSISPNVRGAAALLGASPTTILRLIDLPLIGRGLIVGATFAFTVSMGEFGASLFVARPETPTMPLVIFRLLGQPGALNYGQALAMSAILMGVCAISFVLIERARVLGIGEF